MKERRTPASDPVGASKTEAQSPPPGAGGRRLVILGRLLLLLAAAVALASALALVHERDRQGRRSSTDRYACPMHPEVVSAVPGDCPICHMALTRVTAGEGPLASQARSGVVGRVERRIVSQMVRAPAWVDAGGAAMAQLYEDDLVGSRPGEHALFFGTAAPGVGIPARLSSDPPVRWDPPTVLVRFQVQRPVPVRSETGWIQLSSRFRELLVVPASAVLYSGEGAYVLAAPPDGHTFTRRAVQVGRILDSGYAAGLVEDRYGTISVLSGLEEGERVVVSDTFFLDAERRLQIARGNKAEVIR